MQQVLMPQMGVSVAEGTILGWRRKPGDAVQADETLADVTTDKVDVEIPCPASGTLARVLVEPGETVAVGTPIAEIEARSEIAGETQPADAPDGDGDREAESAEVDRSRFYSPVVQRMAAEHGIDLDRIDGSGIGGRVRKADVLAAIESPEAEAPERPLHTESPYVPETPASNGAAAGAASGLREPMTPMRKAIARHMVESRRTSAHCTTIVEVDMSSVAAARSRRKEPMAARGVKLTYLAFVATATVEALGEFPVLNSSVEGEELVHHPDVNLGVAVALDEGLIVPVIPRAQRLSLEGMAAAIADVAERARAKRLEPDEVQGGTFTITNPGQFGAVLATPIINQPQVGILDLEAVVKRAVVQEGAEGDSIAIRPMAYLPMSWDHRALDGAVAARFLGHVKARLETWEVA